MSPGLDDDVRPDDALGPPYVVETLVLTPDDEGVVEATLVHRPADGPAPGGASGRPAVLHVHGFADYFFQTEYAAWWTARGYDFYALDLRKYGRSLREHQTPNFTADLADYYEELDEAWQRVVQRDGHTRVLLSAHSTGGLTAPLWAHDRRPGELAGLVLNSPWFDLQGPMVLRSPVARLLIQQLGSRRPLREVPRAVTGHYGRSLHSEHAGEWSYNLDWKPITSWPIYFGWLGAVRRGQARLHAGLAIEAPVLVLTSASSSKPRDPEAEDVHLHDIVLDVQQIHRWSPQLGNHVTVVAVEGARHDVVLSRQPARARVYDELDRWLRAYPETPYRAGPAEEAEEVDPELRR